jgi:hypothetical protein
MADLGDAGWRGMVCVETGNIAPSYSARRSAMERNLGSVGGPVDERPGTQRAADRIREPVGFGITIVDVNMPLDHAHQSQSA